MIKNYKVLAEGSNFLIKLDGEIGKYGFFSTRYVKAKDLQNAEISAMDLIREELGAIVLNDDSDPPIMYTEEINEIINLEDNISSGPGFTWFKEDNV